MGYYPLVSVIIATYNAGKYLRRALDSVYSQSYTNVECIVVDGCSKDNTLDIVREYVCKNIVYISEQDLGIYDALNKGVLIAKGEWIYVLGADDELLPDGLRSFFLGENDFEYDIIYGNTIDRYFDGILRYTKSKCCSRVRYEILGCHQGMIMKRKMILDLKGFNLKYPLKADFALVQKAYLSGYRFRKIDSYIAYFSMEGATGTSYRIMDKEHLSILRDNHAVLFPRLVMGLIGIKKIIKVFYLKFFYGK